jgi:hypothetical protein
MKTIQSVNVWQNGQVKSATKFNMNSVFDDLETSATFYYELLSVSQDEEGNEVLTQVAQGNLVMNGEDYQNWNTSEDANKDAYIWGANQLSLTIV